MKVPFRWLVEIEIDETWVADGFDLTPLRMKEMLERALPDSTSAETRCRILSAPERQAIAVAQGRDRAEAPDEALERELTEPTPR